MTSPNAQTGEPRDAAPGTPTAQLDALGRDLTELRERLADLDYRAVVLGALIAADDQRHLDVATHDLELAVTAFRASADAVVARSEIAAEKWGVRPEQRTLAMLATNAPDQWRGDLANQTRALLKETERLKDRLRADRGHLGASHRHLSNTLEALLGETTAQITYEADAEHQARLVDHLA